MRRCVTAVLVCVSFLAVGATVADLAAQQAAPESLRTMRHFWHVFIAYAVAWLLVLGWVVAIVRRLGRVEKRLERGPRDR